MRPPSHRQPRLPPSSLLPGPVLLLLEMLRSLQCGQTLEDDLSTVNRSLDSMIIVQACYTAIFKPKWQFNKIKYSKWNFDMSFLELTSCIKLQKSFNTACVCCSLENATKIFVWFLTGCLAQLPATLSVANWRRSSPCSTFKVYLWTHDDDWNWCNICNSITICSVDVFKKIAQFKRTRLSWDILFYVQGFLELSSP